MLAQAQADQDRFDYPEPSLAQVRADIGAAERRALRILGMTPSTLKRKAGDAAQLLMKIAAYTPWGGQLAKARTIVRFIDDLRNNRPITATKVMDLACAINSFLPSASGLTSFFSANASQKVAMIKTVARSQFSSKKFIGFAKTQGKNCLKNLVAYGEICHLKNVQQVNGWIHS